MKINHPYNKFFVSVKVLNMLLNVLYPPLFLSVVLKKKTKRISRMVYTQIAIINQSTVVTDANGQFIVSAMNMILPTFCSDWNIPSVTAVYVGLGKTTMIPLKVFLLDNADVDGALAYHDQTNDLPYGKAFAKTVLSYGGTLLYSTNPLVPTFAQSVCHEVFELLVDMYCNMWAMLPDYTTLYAYEVCDPVESNALTVNVLTTSVTKIGIKTTTTIVTTKVGLSDWVLPKWFDPQATRGPYNHNNTLTAPFTLSPYGYVIALEGGNVNYVFGSKVSDEKKSDLAKDDLSKRAKPLAKTPPVPAPAPAPVPAPEVPAPEVPAPEVPAPA